MLAKLNTIDREPFVLWILLLSIERGFFSWGENMENKRDFKGVWIPKTVWLDTRLNALEKVILAEIDSLDSSERGCWASNKHIAEFAQCSETKVSTAVTKLIKLGYLYVQKFDGRQRELKSRLSNFERQTLKNNEADFKNQKESNTESNPVSNTDIYNIVEYLNQKAEKNYKPTTKATQNHIKARMKEGFTVNDFKAVIDKKVKEWKGTKMDAYLRPETLFGTKFEGYLNAGSVNDAGNQKPVKDEPKYGIVL